MSIRADGSVEKVEIERSSGHEVLDRAARRVVQLGAPFSPFPPAIRKEYDILSITRSWSFTRAEELVSEYRGPFREPRAMTDRYAVIGNPIAHSKSPVIHAAFARQTGQDIVYERILGPIDGFQVTVDAFRAEGGRGLNVTLPFKLEACDYATKLSDRAEAAGAVNVLKFEGADAFGDNTDGAGLVRDLQAQPRPVAAWQTDADRWRRRRRPGAIAPLLACGVADPRHRQPDRLEGAESSRTDSLRAGRCAPRASRGWPRCASTWSSTPRPRASAASGRRCRRASTQGCALAYEMMYGRGRTPFMQQALAEGAARVADGLGMLVEQAAEAFELWRGVRPDTAPVLAQLRQETS